MTALDDYRPLRPPQLPRNKSRVPAWVISLAVAMMTIVTLTTLIAFALGVVDEYHRATVARAAAEKRAEAAEKQLAAMLKSADCGVLIANLQTDMGPTQLRLVPGRK